MKVSFPLFLTTVWVFFSGCARAENCREFAKREVIPIVIDVRGREGAPACSQTDQ
ncbi:hypothetical protein NPIL_117221, partial [Nephila pilipes]